MKQQYHTIMRPQSNGWFVGWVEEIPGTITHGRSIDECRSNLRKALELMLETRREQTRDAIHPGCVIEMIEVDSPDPPGYRA